jgi:hypothetical protein
MITGACPRSPPSVTDVSVFAEIPKVVNSLHTSVPTDCRSFRTGPKKILEDGSVQDLKIAKRTSKDLFFDPGTIIRFFKMASLEF